MAMPLIDRYCELYEHEKDCDQKLLDMIDSVPKEERSDPRFQKAVNLAGHLAACRENWLDRMASDGLNQVEWYDDNCDLETLRPRFAAMEARWTEYLANLSETELVSEFEFPSRDGDRYRWQIDGQILQLIGHAPYHRGQIALLVDQLGGETVDTDYLYWAISQNPRYGKIVEGK
jgi:uncharacterized damage-inducible protein DinB